MILVDTSVWVDHLRRGNPILKPLLEKGDVLCHDLIVGELSCGSLKNREEVLALLANLPRILQAAHKETLMFVTQHGLYGKGIGWIDAHLLASARLSHARLWTIDRRLAAIANNLKLSF